MFWFLFLFFIGLLFILYQCITYFFVRVPYLGTSKKRAKIIFEYLQVQGKIVYDLGCGKGDFLFVAEKYGAKKLVGAELWPVHYWFAFIKKWLLGSKIEFRWENYFDAHIFEADIIYLFLTPPAMKMLAPKILKEAHVGTRVASLGSPIQGFSKEEIVPLDKTGQVSLYVYKIEKI